MPFIQLAKVNHAVALFRRKQEMQETMDSFDMMMLEYVKDLNESEYQEYIRITNDTAHPRLIKKKSVEVAQK